jgi:hypothetical protein
MVLERDFPKLKCAVNSRGKDTTLLIRGPGNLIVCGDDTGGRKDAIVEAKLESGSVRNLGRFN